MTATRPSVVVILAAGEGKRMRSATPKVLHELAGRSLIGHVIEAAAATEPHHVVVVVGHGRAAVQAHLAEVAPWVLTVVQAEQGGTGHAVRVALQSLAEQGIETSSGPVLVLTGDTPLLSSATLVALVAEHAAGGAAATILTARVGDPAGYGRIVRDQDGLVQRVIEDRDATPAERAIDEINSGMYAFDAGALVASLDQVTRDNAQGEEYLTDVVAIMRDAGRIVTASQCGDDDEVRGVNDRVQLAEAASVLRDRINQRWMRAGVTIVDPASTWLDVDVDLAADVTLRPQVTLRGPTSIAAGAVIGPGSTLTACEVGAGAEVVHTWAELAVVGDGARVGPFTFLRPGTVLGAQSRAGAYVEIKNATVGDGAKVPHLSYVGDAEIGAGTNIGAATIFVNYDGIAKHRTVVGAHARVGSDTMLVAPVEIGDGAYTAAGSVITEDVPAGAMAVGRARQRNIAGWVGRRRAGTTSAQAAAAAHEADSIQPDAIPPDSTKEPR